MLRTGHSVQLTGGQSSQRGRGDWSGVEKSLRTKSKSLLRTGHSVEMTDDLASLTGREDWVGVESDAVMKEEIEVLGGVPQRGWGANRRNNQHL